MAFVSDCPGPIVVQHNSSLKLTVGDLESREERYKGCEDFECHCQSLRGMEEENW